MGLSQALYSAVSGLVNHQKAMDNIGNNLANVNTVAFKKGVFQFQTVFSQMLSAGSAATGNRGTVDGVQLGLGTSTGSIRYNYTQGNLESTANPLDMAIQGNGYFVLQNSSGRYYTRDGTFLIGDDGYLQSVDGYRVQGVLAQNGSIPTSVSLDDILINLGEIGGAAQTTEVAFSNNLDKEGEVATGLKLTGFDSLLGYNGVSNRYVRSYLSGVSSGSSYTSHDSTWNAINGIADVYLNGGNVQTTAALGVRRTAETARNAATYIASLSGGIEHGVDVSYGSSLEATKTYITEQILASVDNIDANQAAELAENIASVLSGYISSAVAESANSAMAAVINEAASINYGGNNAIDPFMSTVAQGQDGTTTLWDMLLGNAQNSAENAVNNITSSDISTDINNARTAAEQTIRALAEDMGLSSTEINTIVNIMREDGVAEQSLNAVKSCASDIGAAVITDISELSAPSVEGGLPLYTIATLDTDLKDLYYNNNGTWTRAFANIENGKTIEISFEKGDRQQTATFTYANTPANDPTSAINSYTLEHLMNFLAGDVDDVLDVSSIEDMSSSSQNRLEGGIMGTVKLAAQVSNLEGDDVPEGYSVSQYDAPAETAGAFTRSGVQTGIDYSKTSGSGNATGNSFNLSIVSNLGSENAISNISFKYNGTEVSNFFTAETVYQTAQGGSATTDIVLYDSVGSALDGNIQMSLVSRDSTGSTWRWIASSSSDTDAQWQLNDQGEIATNSVVGTGLIRFDSNGRYVEGCDFSESGGITIDQVNQGVNNPITLSIINGQVGNQQIDFSSMTQYALANSFKLSEQDGMPPGTLDSFTVSDNGTITGVYSNGYNQVLARLVLATVTNEQGLSRIGQNLYLDTPESGAAQIDFAEESGKGSVKQAQLEVSNVDISEEFTRMILTQRGFQANARIVTTADEMLQELVNLKR